MRRVKVVLGFDEVRRLLGLPDGVRVVGLGARPDPDRVVVMLEGDALPDMPYWKGAPTPAMLAAQGVAEAPVMWHPIIGGSGEPPPVVVWEGWTPGDLETRHPAVVERAGADVVA